MCWYLLLLVNIIIIFFWHAHSQSDLRCVRHRATPLSRLQLFNESDKWKIHRKWRCDKFGPCGMLNINQSRLLLLLLLFKNLPTCLTCMKCSFIIWIRALMHIQSMVQFLLSCLDNRHMIWLMCVHVNHSFYNVCAYSCVCK